MLLRGLIVFSSAVLLDALWTLYIRRSSQGRALSASFFASVLLGLGAFNAISYLENHWMLLPAMAGAFVGTYGTLLWERRKKQGETAREVDALLRETSEHEALPLAA